ncbi:hypothetical protein B296_00012851, partial [Ensete ventricosum]
MSETEYLISLIYPTKELCTGSKALRRNLIEDNSCQIITNGDRYYRYGKGRTARYIPVRQLTDTRTGSYRAVPLKSTVGSRFRPSTVDFGCRRSIEGKIDRRRSIEGKINRWRSIEGEIDRQRSIEEEKGKRKKKEEEEKKKKEEEKYPTHDSRATFLPARGEIEA